MYGNIYPNKCIHSIFFPAIEVQDSFQSPFFGVFSCGDYPDGKKLGGGFKYFLFSPWSLGKWSNLTIIFFRWVGKKPPTRKCWVANPHEGLWTFPRVALPSSTTPHLGPNGWRFLPKTQGGCFGFPIKIVLTWPMAKRLKLFGMTNI